MGSNITLRCKGPKHVLNKAAQSTDLTDVCIEFYSYSFFGEMVIVIVIDRQSKLVLIQMTPELHY